MIVFTAKIQNIINYNIYIKIINAYLNKIAQNKQINLLLFMNNV